MSQFNAFDNTMLALAKGQIDFDTDTFKIYLSNTAPSKSADSVKADLAEIAAGNGYVAGGKVITVNNVSQTNGSLSISVDTPTEWQAAGGTIGPARYVVMYDDTHANDLLIGWWDYGESVTPKDQEKFGATPTNPLFVGSLTPVA